MNTCSVGGRVCVTLCGYVAAYLSVCVHLFVCLFMYKQSPFDGCIQAVYTCIGAIPI